MTELAIASGIKLICGSHQSYSSTAKYDQYTRGLPPSDKTVSKPLTLLQRIAVINNGNLCILAGSRPEKIILAWVTI
jgi:hypothetical protein